MTLSLAGPLLLVGAGKMGGALLEGWLRQGLDPATVFIQDPAPPSPEVGALIARHGIEAGSAPDLPAAPSVILLAVKPDIVQKLLPEVEPLIGEKTVVLSIAAGRTLRVSPALCRRARPSCGPCRTPRPLSAAASPSLAPTRR